MSKYYVSVVRKSLSALLVVSLLFASLTTVWAGEGITANKKAATKINKRDKVAVMIDNAGLSIEKDMTKKGKRTLRISSESDKTNDSAEIIVIKADSEKMVLDVVEDNMKNQLVFTDTGEMYVDGNIVNIEIVSDTESQVKANVSSSNTMTCLYGKPSDYTTPSGDNDKININSETLLSKVTKYVFSLIISNIPGLAGFFAGIALDVAEELYNQVNFKAFVSKQIAFSMSITYRGYYHAKTGALVHKGMAIERRLVTWYTKKDAYGDAIATQNIYRITVF